MKKVEYSYQAPIMDTLHLGTFYNAVGEEISENTPQISDQNTSDLFWRLFNESKEIFKNVEHLLKENTLYVEDTMLIRTHMVEK